MNDRLKNRLKNWKFIEALEYMENATESEQIIIKALAITFGNCGWVGGTMGIIINAIVETLLEDKE